MYTGDSKYRTITNNSTKSTAAVRIIVNIL